MKRNFSVLVFFVLVFSLSRPVYSEEVQGRHSELMLESVLRSAPAGIGVVIDRMLVQVNDYILELSGYTQEELIGNNARILYPTQEAYDYVGDEKYRQITAHGTGSVETVWLRKDGEIRYVILSSTPLDLSDLTKGVTFTVLDITDRVHTENALAVLTRRFFIGLGIVIFLLLGMLFWLLWNLQKRKTAERTLANSYDFQKIVSDISSKFIITRKDALESVILDALKRISEHFLLDGSWFVRYFSEKEEIKICYNPLHEKENISQKSDCQNWIEKLNLHYYESLNDERVLFIPCFCDSENERKTSSENLMKCGFQSLMAVPLQRSEKVCGFFGIGLMQQSSSFSHLDEQRFIVLANLFSDLLFKLHHEELLVEAIEKAEECNRLKDAFLANLSHEIRTPMSGILGFVSLLEEEGYTDSQRKEFFQMIQYSGQRMISLIDDLVNLAKIEAGAAALDLSRIGLNEELKRIIAVFEKNVANCQREFRFHGTEEKIFLKTDLDKFFSILSNLIKNALEYSTGPIDIGYELGEKYSTFYVTDHGKGISLDDASIIFERFRQLDQSYSKSHQGAGLGLAICKAYVELLGGKIWVESMPGQGATFKFTHPSN